MRVMVLRWNNSDVTYEGAKPFVCVKTYFGNIVDYHLQSEEICNNSLGQMANNLFWIAKLILGEKSVKKEKQGFLFPQKKSQF